MPGAPTSSDASREAQVLDLVRVPARLGAAAAQDVPVHLPQGDVDGELHALVQHLAGEPALPDEGDEDGFTPLHPQSAPADGHGVDLLSAFGGQQDALSNGAYDLLGVVEGVNLFFHSVLLLSRQSAAC